MIARRCLFSWQVSDVFSIFSTGRYIVIVHPMKSRSLCTLTNCRSEKYSWDSKFRSLGFLLVVKIFFLLPYFAPKLTFQFTFHSHSFISCQDPVLQWISFRLTGIICQDPCLSLQCNVLRNKCLRKTVYTDRHYKIIAFNWTCEIFAFHCNALFFATNV